MLAGRYRLEATIGQGGMATVWRARDTVLRRRVAVKILREDRTGLRRVRQAVRAEALATARLSHPHIAAVHDYGETDDDARLPYIVYEYVDGGSLAARITGHQRLTGSEATAVCADVAAALSAAHSNGIVHRDIKPGNVLLSPDGVKVVDFGVSHNAGKRTTDRRGRVTGTVIYMSPEQLCGQRAQSATDVFALGLLLRESLTGRPAWTGPDPADVLHQQKRTPVPALPEDAGLSREVRDLYRACLAVAPDDRPTAREAERVLRTAVTGSAPGDGGAGPSRRPCAVVVTRPAPPPERPSSRRLVLAVAVPAAVAAGLLAMHLAGVAPAEAAAGPPAQSPSVAAARR